MDKHIERPVRVTRHEVVGVGRERHEPPVWRDREGVAPEGPAGGFASGGISSSANSWWVVCGEKKW
jgi:hypothetical protein